MSMMPWPRYVEDDSSFLQRLFDCSLFDMGTWAEGQDLTEAEERTGYRVVTHADHEHRYAVGWRAEQEQREADAKREAEMAACPYVTCQCGHHESD